MLATYDKSQIMFFSKYRQDFVGAKFYCPHALAGGNQRILIREMTLEFYMSPTMCLRTLK